MSTRQASPLFDGIREKWIDQGLQKGLREDRIDAIIEVLEENIGCYPDEVVEKLRAIRDMGTLKMLLRRAVKAKSPEEFLAALDGAKGKAN